MRLLQMVSELGLSIARASNRRRALQLVRRICEIAGSPSLIEDARVRLARHDVIAAVLRHDTPVIFNWLIEVLSYQGVSDRIAFSYMEQHGWVRWHDVAAALAQTPS